MRKIPDVIEMFYSNKKVTLYRNGTRRSEQKRMGL